MLYLTYYVKIVRMLVYRLGIKFLCYNSALLQLAAIFMQGILENKNKKAGNLFSSFLNRFIYKQDAALSKKFPSK